MYICVKQYVFFPLDQSRCMSRPRGYFLAVGIVFPEPYHAEVNYVRPTKIF